MGINTIADKTPLLDNADQNIGNSATIQPQAGAVGTIIPQMLRDRILNLQSGSASGQTTSVIMTASRIVGPENPYPGLPGPITGVAEFGNGGRSTRVEFDVPIGPFVGTFQAALSAQEPQDGGVIITLPTGVLRIYARYDNLLITPTMGSIPPQSMAQLAGVPFVGPGGPTINTPAEPLLVKAMVAYFSHPRSKAYKTINCYVSQFPPIPITIPLAAFCLPAFAKKVKVLRLPLTSALNVQLSTGVQTVDRIAIAAGVSAPVIDLMGHESIIAINSSTPADTVTYLALVCELGI